MTTLRETVSKLLGSSWSDAQLEFVEETPDADTPLRHVLFRNQNGEAVPARYLPSRNGAAVLYCHAHGSRYDIGPKELTDGRPALCRPYLNDFVDNGWGVLCLEMPCFGIRATPGESTLAKAHLWRGSTLFGQMLGEQRCGFDWLKRQPDIDADRIAVMGVSMGGTLAWWLAAMTDGLAGAVSIACFADLDTLISTGAHDGHGIYMTVPGLLSATSTGALCGLAAPTPLLHCVGLQDWSTPEPAFDRAASNLRNAYAKSGCESRLRFLVDAHCGHEETEAMRTEILAFLRKVLAPEF